MPMYHDGNRELQDRFGSRPLADRLVERLWRDRFKDEDKAFIESTEFFFLATADAAGRPDCSFKGGPRGFVRILRDDLLVFPDYDGNGMFKSLGNIRANPHVGLLFISFEERRRRIRVNGTANLSFDDPLLESFPGGQVLVRVTPEHIFPNCPRYIPKMQMVEASEYVPQEGCVPPEPEWKGRKEFETLFHFADSDSLKTRRFGQCRSSLRYRRSGNRISAGAMNLSRKCRSAVLSRSPWRCSCGLAPPPGRLDQLCQPDLVGRCLIKLLLDGVICALMRRPSSSARASRPAVPT
jgi:predicted pyridoxine 5'-phosphate oxidase superfamily flavin-nucleotide-binding protein